MTPRGSNFNGFVYLIFLPFSAGEFLILFANANFDSFVFSNAMLAVCWCGPQSQTSHRIQICAFNHVKKQGT